MRKLIVTVALGVAACGGSDADGPDAQPPTRPGQWVLLEDVEQECAEYTGGITAGEGAVVSADAVTEWIDGGIGFRDLVSGSVSNDSNEIDIEVVLNTTEVVEPELTVKIRAVDFGDEWVASVLLLNPDGDDCGGGIGLNYQIEWTPE